MRAKLVFRATFEQSVCLFLATDAKFVASYLPYLTEDMFPSAAGKLIFKLIKADERMALGQARGLTAFQQRLTREVDEGRLKAPVIEEALELLFVASLSRDEIDSIKVELDKLLKTYQLGTNVDDLVMTFAKKGDIAPFLGKLIKIDEIGKAEAKVESFGMDQRLYDYMATEAQLSRIPSGADSLDALIGGGPVRGGIVLTVGSTGGGKSQMCSQAAASALVCGLAVAYISLEISTGMIGRRMMAAMSGLPIDFLSINQKWGEEVIQARGNNRGIFRVCKMPGLGTIVLDIKRQLREWCAECGIDKFDVIIVDYVDRLAGVSFIPKEMSGYVNGAQCMQALRDIAEEQDAVLWTPSQATRLKSGAKQDITVNDTADSMHKPRIADLVISLNNNESQMGGRGTGKSSATEVVGKVLKDRNSRGNLKTPPCPPMYAYGHVFPSSYLPLFNPKEDWVSEELLNMWTLWQLGGPA